MNVAGTHPQTQELSCGRNFAGKSGDNRLGSVIVAGRTAEPGLISEPGPACLGEASAPFADCFPYTLGLSCDLGVGESSSGEEDDLCTEHISLWAGRFASNRLNIGSVLSGQRNSDWVGTWKYVLPGLSLLVIGHLRRKQFQSN